MAIYLMPPAHEQLNVFFGNLFSEMRKTSPETYGTFLNRAEQEFRRAGYRDEISTAREGVKNILVVRLDVVGDMILTSGFLRELRKNFPRARITLVVSPLVFPIVELCPYVNEVLRFDKNSLDRNFVPMLERIAVFCRENLWRKKFSLAFSPQCGGDSFPGLLMLWLSGARERIGYDVEPYRNFFNENAEKQETIGNFLLNRMIRPHRKMTFQAEKHFYLLAQSGFKVTETHMELFFDEEDSLRAREFLQDIPPDCKKVLLGIGAGGVDRKYPVEKYLIALKELVKKNLVFVIVGGKSERDDANFIENQLPHGKVLNLVGKTTLRETEAVIAQSDFYVGNDTGVMHMAAAAKIPCLVLYREAVDRQNVFPMNLSEFLNFPPWQTKSIILRPQHPLDDCATLPPVYGHCHHFKKPHCITQITPQEIIGAFNALERL